MTTVAVVFINGKTVYKHVKDTWGAIQLPDKYESCIYKIVNKNNKKCYVGHTTKKPFERFYEHFRELVLGVHLSRHMQSSWDKHGFEAFEFSVIEFCSYESRLVREQFWMDTLWADFNVAKVAGSTLGTKRTPEERKKFSEIRKRIKTAERFLHTEEAQKRHKEVVSSKEYREKMSKVMKGRIITDETKKRMSEAWKIRKSSGWKQVISDEQRKKMSLSLRGKKKTSEHQAKINAGLARARARNIEKYGFSFSEEVRKKIKNTNIATAAKKKQERELNEREE